MFISMSYFLSTPTIIFSIDCNPSSVLDMTTKYFMVLIFWPPTVKSTMSSSISLMSESLVHSASDFNVSPWSNLTLTF
uniref:Putative secreted protein n=1 Tax=Xenopsylla cheopis TaxID=163159 RepID=A0A6M2DVV0_XENCH